MCIQEYLDNLQNWIPPPPPPILLCRRHCSWSNSSSAIWCANTCKELLRSGRHSCVTHTRIHTCTHTHAVVIFHNFGLFAASVESANQFHLQREKGELPAQCAHTLPRHQDRQVQRVFVFIKYLCWQLLFYLMIYLFYFLSCFFLCFLWLPVLFFFFYCSNLFC